MKQKECALILKTSPRGIVVCIERTPRGFSGENKKRVWRKAPTRRQLLATIDFLLRKTRVPIRNLTRIATELSGGTFSETRAVVTTANALGCALGIPPYPNFVAAAYTGEPSIGGIKRDAT